MTDVTFILTSVDRLFLQPRLTFLRSRSASNGPQTGTANSSYSTSKFWLRATNVLLISFRSLHHSLHTIQSSDRVCFAWNL